MVLRQTIFLSKQVEKAKDSDTRLKEIISSINHYLFLFERNPFFFMIGKFYFQRCVKSWSMVNTHLEKFLYRPKENYSLLMFVLEHEIGRFPQKSFYAKQLQALSQLIATGPQFKKKYFPQRQ